MMLGQWLFRIPRFPRITPRIKYLSTMSLIIEVLYPKAGSRRNERSV